MDDDFEPLRRHGRHQIQQLLAVQVERTGDPPETLFTQIVHRQVVGGIERRIGQHRNAQRPEVVEPAQVADEDPVGVVPSQRAEYRRLARFLNARRRQENLGPRSMSRLHRLTVLADVLKVGHQAVDATFQGEIQLLQRSAQHAQSRRLLRIGLFVGIRLPLSIAQGLQHPRRRDRTGRRCISGRL